MTARDEVILSPVVRISLTGDELRCLIEGLNAVSGSWNKAFHLGAFKDRLKNLESSIQAAEKVAREIVDE